jgi:nucleoid-associated protein YgaU
MNRWTSVAMALVVAGGVTGCRIKQRPADVLEPLPPMEYGTGAPQIDMNSTPITPEATPAPTPIVTTPAPVDPVAAGPQTHVVQAKDTLYALAKHYYGDGTKWPRIQAANPGLVPERMPIGKAIVIP